MKVSIKICDSIYVVTSAPKMPVPVLVFQIGELVKYHQAALPFEYPHEFAYTQLRRYCYQHMDMVFTRICLYDFHSLASLTYPP